MGVVQVSLPDELKSLIERQVAEGRGATDLDAYLTEAARRFAEDVELEGDLVAEAKAGIAEIEEGRYRLVETREDLAEMKKSVMDRVRARLAADKA
jgi:Arc/MetJ-type ribon-helix-helix transcriptional regulator